MVDAGGGTIDITVHKQSEEGNFTELHSPSGGDWGSSYINLKFEELLEELIGAEHIRAAKALDDWYEAADYFEVLSKKKKIVPLFNLCQGAKTKFNPRDPVANVPISALLPQHSSDYARNQISDFNRRNKTELTLVRGTLKLATAMPFFFEPLVAKIINHISTLLSKPALRDVKFLFLVGGFAESPILQARIEKEFGSKVKVVIPSRPGTAVMNGAALYGLDPAVIKQRIVTITVGSQVLQLWDNSKHAGRLQFLGDEGEKYCSECFVPFITVGDTIGYDHEVTQSRIPVYKQQRQIYFNVYGSPKSEVNFVTDAGAKQIGTLDLDIPDVGAPNETREVDLTMKFGGTVFTVTATYRKTKASVAAKFQFSLGMLILSYAC